MAKNSNGKSIRVIAIVVGILLTIGMAAVAWVWQAGIIAGDVRANSKLIDDINPKVQLNTEGRIAMQKDIESINKGIARIETAQTKILEKLDQ